MITEKLTFEKLSWAAFLARGFGDLGPDAYMSVYGDSTFRGGLITNPSSTSNEEVREKLIKGFLNKWRSRFPNTEESASAILEAIQNSNNLIKATNRFTIESVDLSEIVTIKADEITVSEAIARIFNSIANCYGFRTTAGAKIMGIINPGLFVMWDDSIAIKYLSGETKNIFSGHGYVLFLRKMQEVAQQCIADFHARVKDTDPAEYLSKSLLITPAVPLAKYLDEYNWVTITKNIQVPPKWHPCDIRYSNKG